MDEFELKDYFSILKQRRKVFALSFCAIFLLSVLFALHWSNYRSTATVEVVPSEIAPGTTLPAGTSPNEYNESLADLRISHLQEKVLSTGSLIEIITKFNLYEGMRKNTPIADVADHMLKKIKLELISSELANASSAQKASPDELSAIAFTLSFDYNNPLISQQVTNELVSRFLDEDLKDRRNAAHETSMFLAGQLKQLESSMEEQEKNIADFQTKNGNIAPESLAFNQQAEQSLLMNIQSLDSQITTNEGTQGTLRAQLTTVDPYSRVIADGQVLTTPTIQLKALKSQYATLSAEYGPDHPDVVRVRHQIEVLQKQLGIHSIGGSNLQAQIKDVRTNLAAAQKTYGPNHPDVIALRHELAGLEKQLADLPTTSSADNGLKQDADNPAYLQLVDELKSTEAQHESLMAEKKSLLAQQEKFQNAIAANPVAEQKLAALSRDYDNAQLRYRELKEKKMAADMSETIEQDRSGQRLLIINPPELPLHTQPARILFVIAGFILALIGGAGAVVGSQILSQSVVGPRHLESIVGVAPLVTIPHLVTIAETNSIARKRLKVAGIVFASIVVAAIVFSYAVMPLDVLWAIITKWISPS